MTFKLGLSYLPLASAGLDALEAWTAQLSPSLLHPRLKCVLPYLDDYLRTSGSTGEWGLEGKGLNYSSVFLSMYWLNLCPTESQSDVATVMVQSRSTRGGRMPVKVIAQWKEGIEVSA